MNATYNFHPMRVVNSFYLTPADSHKSFYGKAVVLLLKDGVRILTSYGTPVVLVTADGSCYRTWQGWSATTGRHIKSFCGLNKRGFSDLPYMDLV